MLEVVAGIIKSDKGVLLCQRHHASRRFPLKWEFPGGKVEAGETPSNAIIRELHEELAINVEKIELLFNYQFAYPNEAPIHLYFFNILKYSKDIQDLQFEKIEWVPFENLRTYDILKGDIPFLDLYFNLNN